MKLLSNMTSNSANSDRILATQESIVDIEGTLAAADVRSCSQDSVEIQLQRCYIVSRAPAILPFQVIPVCKYSFDQLAPTSARIELAPVAVSAL
jgi:hypothetical protein